MTMGKTKAIDMLAEIIIPNNCNQNWKTGDLTFTLTTALGAIEVKVGLWCWSLFCRGTPEALIDFGLCRPEWLPGFPGNNHASQQVVFEEEGPRLIHGKPSGKRSKAPRIIIRAWGYHRRTVDVRIPMTSEQIEQVEALRAKFRPKNERFTHQDESQRCGPTVRTAYYSEGNVVYLQPRYQ